MAAFEPVACQAAAFRLKGEKRYEEAADLFRKIIQEHPNWEDGGGAFNLAFCLEEIGDFDCALRVYEVALSYDPTNSVFLGNYNALRRMLGSSSS